MDCGLFQGGRQTELRNFNTPLYRPGDVSAVVLTHAHMDHSGLVPRLVKAGYRGPIYATEATCDLLEILWQDAAMIQEHEATWKTRKNKRQGKSGLDPLYSKKDADNAAGLLRPIPFGKDVGIGGDLSVEAMPSGHILGAASCLVRAKEGGKTTTVLFSGDIGRKGQLIIEDPAIPPEADLVFMETTYGNRRHKAIDASMDELVLAINEAFQDKGKVLIPSFAVERTQEIIVVLTKAWHEGRIPRGMLILLDSPLAVGASEVFLKHPELYDEETRKMIKRGRTPWSIGSLKIIKNVAESKRINTRSASMGV
jgi:metallo-beta-lactamase family protein